MSELYRKKSKRNEIEEEDIEQLKEIIKDLKEFKDHIIHRNYIIYTRNKIIETSQGIIVLISKRLK